MKIQYLLKFFGPAGSSRTLTGAFALAMDIPTWLVETEILSVLEEQYFIAHR